MKRGVALKHLVGVNQRVLPESTSPDYEFNYVDISSVGRGALVAAPQTMTFAQAPSRARRVVRDGDVLVSTVRTYLRAVWHPRPAPPGLVASTGFAVLTPGREIDPRFLGWLAESDTFIDQVVARSNGVSYPAMAPPDLGAIKVSVPAQADQRAIADFLDAETAHIDALLSVRLKSLRLLRERSETVLWDRLMRAPIWLTLRQLGTRVTTGPFGTQLAATEYIEGGVPVINPSHIVKGEIRAESMVSVPAEVARRLARHALHQGDIVTGRKGDLGRSALITERENGWICGSDSIAIRTRDAVLCGPFLGLVLRSERLRQELLATSTGTTMANLNEASLLALRVPAPAPEEQREIVKSFAVSENQNTALLEAISRQVGLLKERRQALITAAVTGEIDVRTASGRGVPA